MKKFMLLAILAVVFVSCGKSAIEQFNAISGTVILVSESKIDGSIIVKRVNMHNADRPFYYEVKGSRNDAFVRNIIDTYEVGDTIR